MEKRGIHVRDAIYDQLACFFDLDHSGTVYIASFCNYFRDPLAERFNFFKLNPSLVSTHINDYVKNCLQSKPENLELLEKEIKKEIIKVRQNQEASDEAQNEDEGKTLIPLDLLLDERINAKLL
jgi:hypothetical protein